MPDFYCFVMGNRGRRSEWQGKIFYRKLLNSRFRTWKSYYFELTCVSQKAIVYIDCGN